jgi:hypothetical protein
VLRAIERDSVEVAVAPRQQRALAHLALAAPRLATLSASGGTAQKAAHEVASGQTEKR